MNVAAKKTDKISLEQSLEESLKFFEEIQTKLEHTDYELSGVEVREILSRLKKQLPQKELAIEPFAHAYGWGVRILHITQQLPGMDPKVDLVLCAKECDFPGRYTLEKIWPFVIAESNRAALCYAQREEVHEPSYYEY